MRYAVCVCAALLLSCGWAWADSITVGGVTHDNVLVREGLETCFVQFPSNGGLQSFAKSDVKGFTISGDPAERAVLRAQWKAARGIPATVREEKPDRPRLNEVTTPGDRKPVDLRGPSKKRVRSSGSFMGDGKFMLGTGKTPAARALMRNYPTPRRFRERPVTRAYRFNNAAGALPRVVLNRQAQFAGGGFSGSDGGFGGSGGSGGFGGNRGGVGGFNGGGFGNNNNGGFGGNQNRGGFGGGGGAFGGNRGGGDITAISNISQLFSTFDDRRVGEVPAVISLGTQSLAPYPPF